MRKLLLAVTALSGLATAANATVIASANLFSPLPPSGSTTTIIALQGVAPVPSQSTVAGNGYSISFNNTGTDEGIVQGQANTRHAVPVAGVSGGQPTYLTGDFGSSQTTNLAQSGNYLSTALGTITITFTLPQVSLALLWGSIDSSNVITFNDATNDTLTGAQIQALAAGFTQNGFQGATGSAYVTATTSTSFTSVTLSSSVVSFEAAGIAGSTTGFVTVPEPASLVLLAGGLLGVGLIRRRKSV